MKSSLRILFALVLFFQGGAFAEKKSPGKAAQKIAEVDICIFGATSGGVAAAIEASRCGKSVVLLEPSQHLGGLTTGGLGATDIGNKGAIGGIAREFYERVYKYYEDPRAWKWQKRDAHFAVGVGQEKSSDPLVKETGRPTQWTFEPHVAMDIYKQILREAKVTPLFGQKLASVKKEGARLVEIAMGNGRVFRAKMFIDASYEGDLMAKAGVSYYVGREANSEFDEKLNGVRANTPSHQFKVNVDPYVKPGDASSGLLPFIQSGDGGEPGSGDKRVQAYNFRLCMTKVEKNKVPWSAPKNYDEKKYELLARYIEASEAAGKPLTVKSLMNPVAMPNGKTDTNNNGPFSTDFIGMNYDYPDGDDATRVRIFKEHVDYIRGFLFFLATSQRVPQKLRDEMNSWGLAKDEFVATDHFPPQMYVREARRMRSDYVMTEHDCRWEKKADDPVALGAYNMDSHNCQRIVKNGRVENEGDVQVGVRGPYPVSYRSIVPKASECENLFVPVCLSATHIAYGSIRMEPVFMILGQSAAAAAAQAIDEKTTAQKIDYAKLREKLVAEKQILEWKGAARGGASLESLPNGIVFDDTKAEKTGEWKEGAASHPFVGASYLHDDNADKGKKSVSYKVELPAAGEYDVFISSTKNNNRATNVPVDVVSLDGKKTVTVNQREQSGWIKIFTGNFNQTGASVTIRNDNTDGFVIADAVCFVPVKK